MLLARRRFGAVNGKTTAEEEEEAAATTAEEDRQTDSKKYPVIISLRMGKGNTRQNVGKFTLATTCGRPSATSLL